MIRCRHRGRGSVDQRHHRKPHILQSRSGRKIDLSPSTVTVIVTRLVRAEWLIDDTEAGDPAVLGRPLRRYVHLTARRLDVAWAVAAQNRLLIPLRLPANGAGVSHAHALVCGSLIRRDLWHRAPSCRTSRR
jgi:hypothetical protein